MRRYDEDVKAIDSGQVWSVGLDFYQQEPNIHPGLVSNSHVGLLLHMGPSTVEDSIVKCSLTCSEKRYGG